MNPDVARGDRTGPPPLHAAGANIVDGPRREGSEQRWTVARADGTTVVVAMLLPELSRDVSVRRRWVADVERLVAMTEVEGLLPILEVGPSPDPRDPDAPPPWRVRAHRSDTETLEAWLTRRAPVAVDEATELVARLALIVHGIHRHGVVLRDLHPRRSIVDREGGIFVADVGLSRVEILSSRTAASLILEGSPYAAPEQFSRHTVDQRSDVYGLAVILFRALTGVLPFGEQPAILRPAGAVADALTLRPAIGDALDALLRRCLDEDPHRRPGSAATLARALRGDAAGDALPAATLPCQSCGGALRPGQRLCTHCGRQAVRFAAAPPELASTYDVVLTRVDENAASLGKLREVLAMVGEGTPPALNFLVGDQRMYSKAEQRRLLRLPMPLFTGLTEPTALALRDQMAGTKGLSVGVSRTRGRVQMTRKQQITLGATTAFGIFFAAGAALAGNTLATVIALVFTVAIAISLYVRFKRKYRRNATPLMALRRAPAALEASDPLVRRLAALLHPQTPADVRDQVGALALGIQRLVDHRADNLAEAEQIDAVTQPVDQLVGLVVAQVERIAVVDEELSSLDEATMVRALAAADAIGTTPESDHDALLAGLDRLRALEDSRAASFHRLLEAATLIRRAVELGVSVHDDGAAHERDVQAALAALDDGAAHV